MASREQTERIIALLSESRPEEFYKTINENRIGIGAVLRILYEAEDTVTAGKISEELGVSTARVAVLLKKLAAKGLVVKERSADDHRVTVIRLSEYGEKMANDIRENLYRKTELVIDRIGIEKMEEFISISREIGNALLDDTEANFCE